MASKRLAIRIVLALALGVGCAQAWAASSPGMLLDFEAPAIDGAFADIAGDGFAASGVRFRTVRLSGSVARGAIVTLAPVADGLRILRDASAISGLQAASPALGGGYNDLLMEFAAPLAFIAMTVPFLRERPMVAAAISAGATAVLAHGLPLRLGLVLAAVVGIAAGMAAERWLGRRPA